MASEMIGNQFEFILADETRLRGILAAVDMDHRRLTISEVRLFGTEGRAQGKGMQEKVFNPADVHDSLTIPADNFKSMHQVATPDPPQAQPAQTQAHQTNPYASHPSAAAQPPQPQQRAYQDSPPRYDGGQPEEALTIRYAAPAAEKQWGGAPAAEKPPTSAWGRTAATTAPAAAAAPAGTARAVPRQPEQQQQPQRTPPSSWAGAVGHRGGGRGGRGPGGGARGGAPGGRGGYGGGRNASSVRPGVPVADPRAAGITNDFDFLKQNELFESDKNDLLRELGIPEGPGKEHDTGEDDKKPAFDDGFFDLPMTSSDTPYGKVGQTPPRMDLKQQQAQNLETFGLEKVVHQPARRTSHPGGRGNGGGGRGPEGGRGGGGGGGRDGGGRGGGGRRGGGGGRGWAGVAGRGGRGGDYDGGRAPLAGGGRWQSGARGRGGGRNGADRRRGGRMDAAMA